MRRMDNTFYDENLISKRASLSNHFNHNNRKKYNNQLLKIVINYYTFIVPKRAQGCGNFFSKIKIVYITTITDVITCKK